MSCYVTNLSCPNYKLHKTKIYQLCPNQMLISPQETFTEAAQLIWLWKILSTTWRLGTSPSTPSPPCSCPPRSKLHWFWRSVDVDFTTNIYFTVPFPCDLKLWLFLLVSALMKWWFNHETFANKPRISSLFIIYIYIF